MSFISQRFIEDQKTKYKTTDDYVDACWKLSQGGHCVADNTSPSHSGSQLWRGVKWYRPDHWMFAGVHIVRELNLFHMSERRVQAAEEQLRSYVLSAIKERQEMGKSERVVDDTDRLVPDKLKDKGL